MIPSFINMSMKSWFVPFNIYLLAALCIFGAGCHTKSSSTSSQKKKMSTLRLFLEGDSLENAGMGNVQVTHDKIPFIIDRDPFLDEADVAGASLVNGIGGPEIQVVFSEHGTLMLDMTTTANKGKHIIVMTQFPKTHWIAAPLITKRLPNGIFRFTPDSDLTQDDLKRIVDGLNIVAKKNKTR